MNQNREVLVRWVLSQPKFHGKYADIDSNVGILLQEMNKEYPESNIMVTHHEVETIVDNSGNKLAVSDEYQDGIRQWRQEYPEYAGVIANENVLTSMCDRVNFEALEKLMKQPEIVRLLRFNQETADEQTRISRLQADAISEAHEITALIHEILNPYFEKTGELKQTIMLEQYRKRERDLYALSLEDLRAEAARVRENRRMKSLSPEDLRAQVKLQAKNSRQQFDGFPKLPKTIVLRGEIQPRPLDRNFLLWLANNDIESFKHYTRLYGKDQVTARVNGLEE